MRVLVIEDDRGVFELVSRTLRAEGFAVDHADTGPEGLWKATEGGYDAIVLDILLPGLNGYALCRELRYRGVTTPLLMLTGKAGDYDQAEGLDLGADDYMTKPFSLVVLAARVRALIRRGPSTSPPTLRIADLALDPTTRHCCRAGRSIELTPREYALLRHLMSRAGGVVSKDELLRQVWNDEIADPDVVRVYIGYLRRKIDEPFPTNLIETVRGHGYRLGSGSVIRDAGLGREAG